jgi:hypothetical protein
MIQFLEDLKGVGTPPISGEEREELDRLRKEQTRLKKLLKDKEKHQEKDKSDGSDESEVSQFGK